jgi:hypothetical protein
MRSCEGVDEGEVDDVGDVSEQVIGRNQLIE